MDIEEKLLENINCCEKEMSLLYKKRQEKKYSDDPFMNDFLFWMDSSSLSREYYLRDLDIIFTPPRYKPSILKISGWIILVGAAFYFLNNG